MNKSINIIVFVFLCGLSFSQTAKEVLLKINDTYLNKSYKMNYSVKGINTITNSSVYNYTGLVAKQDSSQYVKTDYELTLINKNYYIYINKSQEIVVVNLRPKNNVATKNNDILNSLDSIIELSNIKLIGKSNSNYTLEITPKEDIYYSKIQLRVNKEYQLIGVDYFLKDHLAEITKIEITYSNIVVGSEVPLSYFAVPQEIKIKKDNISTSGQYAHYEVIDQRNIKTFE